MSTATQPVAMVPLPAVDVRVKEVLQEIVIKSVDKFTGSMLIHFQDGVALDVETRTKRRLRRD